MRITRSIFIMTACHACGRVQGGVPMTPVNKRPKFSERDDFETFFHITGYARMAAHLI
jgi:hypothetical protein